MVVVGEVVRRREWGGEEVLYISPTRASAISVHSIQQLSERPDLYRMQTDHQNKY